MPYRTLGRTGMKVSTLCLGSMMFGPWGNPDHDDCARIIDRALDAGINFVDTADVYSAGESEVITGKAIRARRDDVILATKCHFPVATGPFAPHPAPNTHGNSRRHIVRACEDSLRRLDTDWIDLYQIHRPDPSTEIDETLGALSDLLHQGKIRAFGSSTFPADQIVEAQWIADERHRERFQCEQPPYSILVRWVERDLLPAVHRYGMGAIVWSPLNGGWLSGAYRHGMEQRTEGRAAVQPGRFDLSDPHNQRKLDLVEHLQLLADECGLPLAHLALAWVLEHPAVTSAIIGPRTMDQLERLLGADDHRLPPAVLDRIDELVPPGSTVQPGEAMWEPPHLRDASLRRRHR
ncbi:MAG: aldo/keto reductase [Acidimicrobiales bacterium]|nr:aldo/keto reductase [Acidimicrobiales bacterium]